MRASPHPSRSRRPRVAVYAIARNEASRVERWLASAAGADAVVLVDTGSSDGTAALARRLGADVHSIEIEPFRYDDARNRALALLPEGVDLCVSLDLDEVLDDGWRGHLDDAWRAGATRVRCVLEWSWSDIWPPLRFTVAGRIHARHGYAWRYPVHEEIVAEVPETVVRSPLLIRHLRGTVATRPHYLPLLRLRVAEHPEDGRSAHLLACELRQHGLFDEAIVQERRALTLPLPPNDRLHAQLVMSRLEPAAREAWLLVACAERPDRREPWCQLAQLHLERGAWRASRAAALAALRIADPPDDYLTDQVAWGPWAERIAAVASLELGDLERALHHAQRAVALAPEDPAQAALHERVRDSLRQESARLRTASSTGPARRGDRPRGS